MVIAITNQKGGVAKTTTATALASGLKLKGYSVLIIDADPQCNTSDTYQAHIEGTATLYDLLYATDPINEVIQHTPTGDIIPSDPQLAQAENLLNRTGKEFILKKALQPILTQYDYIIIDTPPTLGVLLLNALTAADTLIVPITADRYSLQGLSQLQDTIAAAQEYTNPTLSVLGLLLCKFNARTNLSRDVLDAMPVIAGQLRTAIFKTRIRESTAAREAQATRINLYEHAPKSSTAQDYLAFIDELIEGGYLNG